MAFAYFALVFFCSTIVEAYEQLPEILKKVAVIIKATIKNGRIFSGFFYLPLGMLFAHARASKLTGIIAVLMGFSLGVIVEKPLYSLIIAVVSVGLFIIATQIRLTSSPIYYWLRRSSAVIYFIHMYIWTLYCGIRYGKMEYSVEPFVVVSAISLLLSVIYSGFINSHRYKRKT